jgi:hypothetical protein
MLMVTMGTLGYFSDEEQSYLSNLSPAICLLPVEPAETDMLGWRKQKAGCPNNSTNLLHPNPNIHAVKGLPKRMS